MFDLLRWDVALFIQTQLPQGGPPTSKPFGFRRSASFKMALKPDLVSKGITLKGMIGTY